MSDVPSDPWCFLREVTRARIALGRCGGSVPTRELLDFQWAHARARDAVLHPFDVSAVAATLAAGGWDPLVLASAATERDTYLRRPDLGRRLSEESRARLASSRPSDAPCDLVAIITNGLSAPAAERHAAPLLRRLLPRLENDGWQLAPVVVVTHGRVALEDEIGELLGSRLALMLIGERPGLGAPDSLSAYFVHEPRIGRTDAERNCVSNIRPEGLPVEFAADTLHHLLTQARSRQLSGVALKDERNLLPEQHVRLPTERGGASPLNGPAKSDSVVT
jgi:ethanolamine ammonia-lyase small subunit